MNGERLELVTDFDSLRAGDLVVVKPCRWCGGQHRAMLLRFLGHATGIHPSGAHETLPAWSTTAWTHVGPTIIPEFLVADRRLYRVLIPPAETSEPTETSVPSERTRERVGAP